ncbi:MAG: DUF169 domain-containing protein [Alphaproteobacteria bacterium]|jgi:uncharacterized protein (DUF169 family)|nr:DUF169 domain-containing protein [Alphaproteobacteria bacterium]
MSDDTTGMPSGEELKQLAAKLHELLKIRTLPIGMKQYESLEEMQAVPGIRFPKDGRHHTSCQLITQSRIAGFTLGITAANVRPGSNCGGVMGIDAPSEEYLSGKNFVGVWFENLEAARAHQDQMTRQVAGKYVGTVMSPLRSGRLDPPDIVCFYATPGQMILFVNGLQWKRYKRYDMTITGETACSDSWGRALRTRETSISIPCYAERRYGGVADDELLIAMPPDEFARGIEGLEGIAKVGLRYPIPPYGAQMDPAEGMAVSYG